jgi:hypothetical protein
MKVGYVSHNFGSLCGKKMLYGWQVFYPKEFHEYVDSLMTEEKDVLAKLEVAIQSPRSGVICISGSGREWDCKFALIYILSLLRRVQDRLIFGGYDPIDKEEEWASFAQIVELDHVPSTPPFNPQIETLLQAVDSMGISR